jgi:signal transduction histidine kinase
MVLVGLAAAGALLASAVGALVLRRFRRRSLRIQALVVACSALLATVVGTIVAALAMFISPHDLKALVVVLAAGASISVGAALQLGEEVSAGARRVSALANRLATEHAGTSEQVTGSWAATDVEADATEPFPATVPDEFAMLAGELDELARRLTDSRRRERDLERSRRELVAWVSHDLRSPIATIRAMAEALDDGVVDDRETVGRYHHQIRLDAERLSRLVDDLFELSRITSGTLRLDRSVVAIDEVVAGALGGTSAFAQLRGVELVDRLGPLPALEVSAAELTRVLVNVVDNAIRHTPSGGRVVVEAAVVPATEGGGVRISVADECGGIPEPDLGRVFEVAFRGDAARGGDDRGGGLGLAIAKGLVEAHHGSIDVTNAGRGCRFTVRLPEWQ